MAIKKKVFKKHIIKTNKEKIGVLLIILKVWLSLILIVNFLTAIAFIIFNKTLISYFPQVPNTIFYIYGVFALLIAISAIAMLRWKKWGIYLFIIFSLIPAIINLIAGLRILIVLWGLLGLIITIALITPYWKRFN